MRAACWWLCVMLVSRWAAGDSTPSPASFDKVRNLTLEELRLIERSAVDQLRESVKRDPEVLKATSYREGACTALGYAASLGHANVVEVLVEMGADVEARCHFDQFTPLMLATICSLQQHLSHNLCPPHLRQHEDEIDSHAEVVEVLLAKEANVDSVDRQHGRSAAHFASLNGNAEILQLLLRAGANGDAEDLSGWTPLFYAVQRGDLASIKVLVQIGANINKKDSVGATPLAHAANLGHVAMVKELLDHGADQTVQDNMRKTPLDYAQEHSEVRHLLIAAAEKYKTEL